jgi:polysaccharide biosynthesis transport protein
MTSTISDEPRPQPLVDILPLLRTLWQRRVAVVAVVLAVVVVAVGYLTVTRPIYTAQAVVLIDPRKPQTTDTDNVLPGIGSDTAAIASQVAVISSREVLNTVFDRENIATDPEFSKPDWFGALMGVWPNRAMIFDKFAENVWVEREGLTYVIDITFDSQDPDKAARIVNAVVDEYIASQIAEKSDANSEVSELLEVRIAELQQDLTEAERAVEAYRAEHGIYTSANGAGIEAQIDQLQTQLAAAQEAARQAETRAQQALAAGSSPGALLNLSEVLDSPTAEALRTEYNQRALEFSSQQSVLGPRHPTLRRLQTEVERVEGLMVKEVQRITGELVSASDIAKGVVTKIESDLVTLRSRADVDNLDQVELRQLERNAEASRQVLEQFQKRSAETSQFASLQFSDARVITRATAPLRPTWPKSSLLLAVAGVLGLVAGCALALVLGPVKVAARPSLWQRRVVEPLRAAAARPVVIRRRPKVAPPRAVAKPPLRRPVAPAKPAMAAMPAVAPKPAATAKPAPVAKPVPVAKAAQPAPKRFVFNGFGSLLPKAKLKVKSSVRPPLANGKPRPVMGAPAKVINGNAQRKAVAPANGARPNANGASNPNAHGASKPTTPSASAQIAKKVPPANGANGIKNGPDPRKPRGFADLN